MSSGLAPPSESAERRKSVGSRHAAAKSCERWRVPTQSTERELGSGSTCRWKTLRAMEAVRFDEHAAEAVLPSWAHPQRVRRGARRGASETGHQPDTRLKTPRSGDTATSGRLFSGRHRRHERVCGHVEVGDASSSVLPLGAGPSQGVWRRSLKRASVRCRGAVGAGGFGRSTRSGVRRPTGARVERWLQRSTRSIFPVVCEVGREASRSRGEVARLGGSTPDKGSRTASGERVRSGSVRTKSERAPLHSAARSRIESMEGVLGHGAVAL